MRMRRNFPATHESAGLRAGTYLTLSLLALSLIRSPARSVDTVSEEPYLGS